MALKRYVTRPQGITFDVLLAAYLLDTNDNNNDIAGVAAHYDYTDIQSDDTVYGKGAKKGLPEEEELFYAHLSRKVKAIHWLSEKLDQELTEKIRVSCSIKWNCLFQKFWQKWKLLESKWMLLVCIQ